jgi:hypothetical protein
MTRALLIALVFASACKKEPVKGDLPPASDWSGGTGSATDNPHGDNPRGDNPHGDNPHAAPPVNPHGDNPHAGAIANPHSGSVPEQGAPRTLDKLADGRLQLGPFTVAAPADWTSKPVSSNMRAADFVLPGKPGADAELIVYYFGADGAGSVEDNIARWLEQFEQPDGKPSRDVAKIEKTRFGGQDATFVSVTGRFVAQAMPGATQAVDKPDQALLAAIVGSPKGPYYFKLVGAKATVDANARAFRSMLESLKVP